ncbi:MAG TPA: diaminopimelate decarboxylase [Clostridiaceae bacterium]|nr:diaminopimelate decarboxylase [Clostridiaceae bacterium]
MNYYSEKVNFYKGNKPKELLEKYGSPLYVYSEEILRQKAQDMKGLATVPNFQSNYSVKANSNIHLLKILCEEGMYADAMSPGEILALEAAGFTPDRIFYIANNVSVEEMAFAIDRNIIVSVDSLSQLEQIGQIKQGLEVAIRFNPCVGAGHSEKVITGVKKTKFGVSIEDIDKVDEILAAYDLKLVGINQHIGSLYMEKDPFILGVKSLLNIALSFKDLKIIDFGGGFGIPYKKQEGQPPLDIDGLREEFTQVLTDWMKEHGRNPLFKIEPGRYVVAESGILLGTVHAVKENAGVKYAGTDLGFNVLARPVMYDSHHDVEVYPNDGRTLGEEEVVNVVGNICESGDIIRKNATLPQIMLGDTLGVMDAGAYGYAMSSNYNNRIRPAEVLITLDGSVKLIRKMDTYEELLLNMQNL